MLIVLSLILPTLVHSVVYYTVSGISSGGYMTGQMHVTHSSTITGVGIVAAGPYYCAENSLYRASYICTYNDSPLDVSPFVAYASSMSASGQIDPVSNLAKTKVYIYSGSVDELMRPAILEGTYNFYKAFIPESQIIFENTLRGNHAWPTKDQGNPCWYYGIAFVNNCGYDGSGIILTNLLGPLYQRGSFIPENLFNFSQGLYVNTAKASMDPLGFIYIPTNCQKDASKCRLHVNIHGCVQNYDSIGLAYIYQIGMAQWAESNNIVIIFPQTANTVYNEYYGCWDFVGYTDSNYALKSGIQIGAIHSMAQDYVSLVASKFK